MRHTNPLSDVTSAGMAESRLTHVDREASVLEASKLMRNTGNAELLVVDTSGGALFAFGIVTANDIVTRIIAAGLDPAVLTAGDIVWPDAASRIDRGTKKSTP